ncbi:hypothetical protein EN751_41890, partial [Mesorhizobium sp. M4A.F.Ca.ET.029.04.2.1]
ALPFARENYEQAIGAGGRGVKASLAAFAAAYDRARGIAAAPAGEQAAKHAVTEAKSMAKVRGPEILLKGWQELAARVGALPEPVRDMAERGLKKVVDYQDIAYGGEYLDRLDKAVALDGPEHAYALSI